MAPVTDMDPSTSEPAGASGAKRGGAVLRLQGQVVRFLLWVTILGLTFGYLFVYVAVGLTTHQAGWALGSAALAGFVLTGIAWTYVRRTFGPIQRHLQAVAAAPPPDPGLDEAVLRSVLAYPGRLARRIAALGGAVFSGGPWIANRILASSEGFTEIQFSASQVRDVMAVGVMLSLTVAILFYFRLRGVLGPAVALLVNRLGDLPRRTPSGIRGRLFLFSGAVAVLPLFFLGLLFWNQSIRAIEEQMRKAGQNRLQGLAEVLSSEQTFNPSRFEATLAKFAGDEGTILFTERELGRVFYYTRDDVFQDEKGEFLHEKQGLYRLDQSNLPARIVEELGAASAPYEQVDLLGERMVVATPFTFQKQEGKGPQKHFQLIYVFRPERGEISKALGILVVFAVFVAGILAALIFIFSENLTGPLRRIQVVSDKIAHGDLTQEVQVFGDDEVAALALSFRHMHANLGRLIGSLGEASLNVAKVADQLVERSQGIDRSSRTQVESVDDTASSIEEMNTSIGGIASNVEELAASALESASSIQEMSQSIREVDSHMEMLNRSVEGAATSIGQMAASISQIASNVEPLKQEADSTSAAMQEIDHSIEGIRGHSKKTEEIAEQVIEDASQGESAVQRTIQSIRHMNDTSTRTQEAMNELRRTLDEIGEILKIQKSTTDGTHLLALNAAIIAAQAGVQGREFGVIANDIKNLSLTSRQKTKDIEELIEKVQTTGQLARQAVEAGTHSISGGVDLSARAGDSLKQILTSATESTGMVKKIASATVEQARGSRYVLEAVEKIAQGVAEINKATQEQKKGSDLIARSTVEIKDYTRLVKRSTREQSVGINQVVRNIETIREMVNSINRATGELRRGSQRVVHSIDTIREATRRNGASIVEMNTSVKSLRDQSEALTAEVRRFKLSSNGSDPIPRLREASTDLVLVGDEPDGPGDDPPAARPDPPRT